MEGGNGKVLAPRSVYKPGKTDDENDDSSVKSEDITNMLRKVIGGDGDIEMFEADETEAINVAKIGHIVVLYRQSEEKKIELPRK